MPNESSESGSEVRFDPALALHHAGDETELLRTLVEMFLEDIPGRLDVIEAAAREGDAQALEQATHALKGTAAILALGPVRERAWALEKMGASGDLADAAGGVVQLRRAVEEAVPDLRDVLMTAEG